MDNIKRIPETTYHIKDKIAGYYRWRIEFACTNCGKQTSDNLHGIREDIEAYMQKTYNLLCLKCQKEIDKALA